MDVIQLPAKIEEMELDPLCYRVYCRIVHSCNNSAHDVACHDETQDVTARYCGISKNQIRKSMLMLHSLNMIKLRKFIYNQTRVFLVDPSDWGKEPDVDPDAERRRLKRLRRRHAKSQRLPQ